MTEMELYADARTRNAYEKAIVNAEKTLETMRTQQEVEEFATFGQTMKSLEMMIVTGLATPEAVARYVATCESERYGNTPDFYYDYSRFATVKHDYENEILEREVLHGFTVKELRKLVELDKLSKKYAAFYFAHCYSSYYECEFEDFYDVNSFDPTTDFGFIKNEGE